MGPTVIKPMDLRAGGNPFPAAQQQFQEDPTSFPLPIPWPPVMNPTSQRQPWSGPISYSALVGHNITEFDIAANGASLQPPAPIQQPFLRASPSCETSSLAPYGDSQFEFGSIVDNGTKPPYSYAHLIGMAILRSPHRRLTLNQIYTWIMKTFEYYRVEGQSQETWKNSVRHSLSVNKAFVKVKRPKGEPGKGRYWEIIPGTEAQFSKSPKGRRRSVSSTNDNGKRSRRNFRTPKLPMFELESPKLTRITVARPCLQESPVFHSMDTRPPARAMKVGRKRKSFRDSAFFEGIDSGNTSFAAKRPRLDSVLSDTRIVARSAPPSFTISASSHLPQVPHAGHRVVQFAKSYSRPHAHNAPTIPTMSAYSTRIRREDINRFVPSSAKSVNFESSSDGPTLHFDNSPAKLSQFQDESDDVLLRYVYGSPAKREMKRRNYWRQLESGFDPADIEGKQDATAVCGVNLMSIFRLFLREGPASSSSIQSGIRRNLQ